MVFWYERQGFCSFEAGWISRRPGTAQVYRFLEFLDGINLLRIIQNWTRSLLPTPISHPFFFQAFDWNEHSIRELNKLERLLLFSAL